MSDRYFDWIEREGRASHSDQIRVQRERFLPVAPEPSIVRVTLDRDETCSICRDPLFFGEIAYLCETTHQAGCCEEHCREAAEAKLRLEAAR